MYSLLSSKNTIANPTPPTLASIPSQVPRIAPHHIPARKQNERIAKPLIMDSYIGVDEFLAK
jgi:hypothetical protein